MLSCPHSYKTCYKTGEDEEKVLKLLMGRFSMSKLKASGNKIATPTTNPIQDHQTTQPTRSPTRSSPVIIVATKVTFSPTVRKRKGTMPRNLILQKVNLHQNQTWSIQPKKQFSTTILFKNFPLDS